MALWGGEILGVGLEFGVGEDRGEGKGDKRRGLGKERREVCVEREVTGQMLETRVERGSGAGDSV